ncbi:hypothetical protein HWV62_16958 [Athelia sp. TMB]|nr:hypothetical protein HWV62_16958 [Athelia sp. TMB]
MRVPVCPSADRRLRVLHLPHPTQVLMAQPGPGTELFPALGTYVVFSIDAEMTLEALNDPHVTEVTKNMQNKSFVGYVAEPDCIINHDSEFQSFRVEMLREGFPARDEEAGIESDMSQDFSRAAETRRLHQLNPAVVSPQADRIDDRNSMSNGSQASLSDQGPGDEHDSIQSAQDFAQAIVNMAKYNRPPETMTAVEMTYDLSFAKTLIDPQEFFAEQKVLEKLEQDTKDGAIERAKKIDEEAFGGARTQSSAPQVVADIDIKARPSTPDTNPTP